MYLSERKESLRTPVTGLTTTTGLISLEMSDTVSDSLSDEENDLDYGDSGSDNESVDDDKEFDDCVVSDVEDDDDEFIDGATRGMFAFV